MWNNNYSVATDSLKDFMYRVYGWMTVALGVTAGVAYWVAQTPEVFNVVVGSPLMIVLVLAQLGVVVYLSARVFQMEYSTALTAFLAYAVLSGLTFSVYFYAYTMASIYLALSITAGTFLAMALYGYFTRADLSAMGSFLVMGLFGLMIAMIVNIFFRSPIANYYISLIAVGIFTLLTAYDVQKIKQMGQQFASDPALQQKMALLGALVLYLDFINLFIHLLQLFGQRKR